MFVIASERRVSESGNKTGLRAVLSHSWIPKEDGSPEREMKRLKGPSYEPKAAQPF
jgi:hypothetical protein